MKLTVDGLSPLQGETLAERLQSLTTALVKFRVDIESALEYAYGSYEYDDIVAGIMQGRFQFYTHKQSFAICELQTMPHYSIYHAFLAGGVLEEVMAMYEALEPVAKTTGAAYATINGRSGWAKPMKEHGWEPRYTIFYKELKDG